MSAPSADQPGQTDLGLWNVFANDAVPDPQTTLPDVMRRLADMPATATTADLLPLTIARFKTSTVRDLGQSPPFFHNGSADTLDDAVRHYPPTAALARAGTLRNAAPELSGIALTDADVAPLAAFLQALDEDYE